MYVCMGVSGGALPCQYAVPPCSRRASRREVGVCKTSGTCQCVLRPVFMQYEFTHRHHLALGGHEGGAVAEAQLGLQGVEVDLQLALLLHLGGLVHAAVVAEVLQLGLHGVHGLLRHAVLQPGHGSADPLQQLRGEPGTSRVRSASSLRLNPNGPTDAIIFTVKGGLTSLASFSYSSINFSFSWFTAKTLQILLAAVSACDTTADQTLITQIRLAEDSRSMRLCFNGNSSSPAQLQQRHGRSMTHRS